MQCGQHHAEALELLRERSAGKAERRATLMREGYPCYTTSADGSAIVTTSCGACAAKPSMRDSATSR
jgi:hypothetical protein